MVPVELLVKQTFKPGHPETLSGVNAGTGIANTFTLPVKVLLTQPFWLITKVTVCCPEAEKLTVRLGCVEVAGAPFAPKFQANVALGK